MGGWVSKTLQESIGPSVRHTVSILAKHPDLLKDLWIKYVGFKDLDMLYSDSTLRCYLMLWFLHEKHV